MYAFLVNNPVLAITFLLIVLAVFIFLFVKMIQRIGLEKVRKIVYDSILKAEHNFQRGDNEQKFEYVVQMARSSIPLPFNLFITTERLKSFTQLSFDLVKDLLDDGKMNGTGNTNK